MFANDPNKTVKARWGMVEKYRKLDGPSGATPAGLQIEVACCLLALERHADALRALEPIRALSGIDPGGNRLDGFAMDANAISARCADALGNAADAKKLAKLVTGSKPKVAQAVRAIAQAEAQELKFAYSAYRMALGELAVAVAHGDKAAPKAWQDGVDALARRIGHVPKPTTAKPAASSKVTPKARASKR